MKTRLAVILGSCLLILSAGALPACSGSSSEGPTLLLDGTAWDAWPSDHWGADGGGSDALPDAPGGDSEDDTAVDVQPEIVECKEALDCADLHGPPPTCMAHQCEGGGCGLIPVADGTPCNDGDQCSHPDECVAGQCVAGDKICDCAEATDCAPYQDDDVCNGEYDCIDGACQIVPESVVECEDDPDDCILVNCVPATGECLSESLPDDEKCDDGDPCTVDDACQEGECLADPLVCDDGDLCTVDGCSVTDAGPECSFIPVDIGDGDLCTTDSCDPATGEPSHAPVDCDDGLLCTNDICNPVDGECLSAMVDCDDGDACSVDTCLPESGKCSHQPVQCDDGDACTDDSCDAVAGCQSEAIVCDDGNECSADSCDPESGCVNELLSGVSCEDGEACTVGDQCAAGACVSGAEVCAACEGKEQGEGCDDGQVSTEGDLCVEGKCVGWTVTQYEAPGLPGLTTFADVDYASGRFLAVGNSTGGDGLPEDPPGTAWAVTLEAGGVAEHHADSERTDVVFSRVSNNLAAGVAGGTLKASFFDGASWGQATDLEGLLEGATPHFGTLGDMWGARLQHEAVAGQDEDLYLLVGRSFGNAKAVARACTRVESGGAGNWSCPKMAITEYEAFEHPRGVYGVVAPADNSPCLDSESCTSAFQQAYMIANGSSGAQATPYLDWYEADDLDVWSWNVGSPSDIWDSSDWTAIAGSGADEVWAVGTGGLLSRHDWGQPVEGDPDIVGLPIAGADDLQFRAVALTDGFVIAAGERDEEFMQNGQQAVTRTLFVVTYDLAKSTDADSAWSYHVLHEATAGCGADCTAVASVLGEIAGAAASGGQVYLVGSTAEGSSTKGTVFFLQM